MRRSSPTSPRASSSICASAIGREAAALSEDELNPPAVYNGTLTLLYRLLFLLYAESRDLLPVREVRGYRRISLQQIKTRSPRRPAPSRTRREASSNAPTARDDRASTTAWQTLFAVVDEGDPR